MLKVGGGEFINNLIKQTVRGLRRNQTESEAILWETVRNRKISGKKFLRQHPIVFKWEGRKRFIVTDFYCHEAKLIVEIDGGIHEKQKEYDALRDFVVKSLGFRVIRFKNEIVFNDLMSIIEILRMEINSPPHPPSLEKRGGCVEPCLKIRDTPSLYKRGGARALGGRG